MRTTEQKIKQIKIKQSNRRRSIRLDPTASQTYSKEKSTASHSRNMTAGVMSYVSFNFLF